MVSSKFKNVGVLGYGKWGKRVVPILKKVANVKFINGKEFQFKNIDKDIEWVFIITPNNSHFKLVKLFTEFKSRFLSSYFSNLDTEILYKNYLKIPSILRI